MTRQRLLILSFSNISSDARVLKQVAYFADKYDVTTCGYGPSPDNRVRHVQIGDDDRIRRWPRRDVALRRFRRMYWSQAAVRTASHLTQSLDTFDVVLANDIDTVGLALALEPANGVHADIHEYAPRQNEELRMWRYFDAPYVEWLCRTFLPHAASMTTVGQGIADEYRRVFKVRGGVVTNATPYAELAIDPVASPIRLVHSGAALRNRQIEMFVDAAKATTTPVTLDLYLMGNDPSYVSELRTRAAGADHIRILDGIPYEHLIERLNQYDIGLAVLPPINFNLKWCLPNKFFDYVQARLGVIIGPSPEMSRLLAEHGVGAEAEGFDAAALTRVLDSLTVDQVQAWKANADASARALSSEAQVEVWGKAIDALMNRELA